MTRPPWSIQLVAEVFVGIFILVLIALPTKIQVGIEALYFLVEDCQKILTAGWNSIFLVVCFVFLAAVLFSSMLPKQ